MRWLSPRLVRGNLFSRVHGHLRRGSWPVVDSLPLQADPDVPTGKGYNREFRHWLVGNIPEENVAKGEVLAEYVGPATPKGTGKHRYVFLVYKQNQGSITFDERRLSNRDGPQRKRFSIKKFAEKYNLEGPIAGNFMKAEYDVNVPKYTKLLGF